MIQNSLIITKKFQTDSETLERQIDDLSSGLCDIAEKLKPELFAKNEQSKVEKDLIDIHVRIEKIKQHIGAVDQEVMYFTSFQHSSHIYADIRFWAWPKSSERLRSERVSLNVSSRVLG